MNTQLQTGTVASNDEAHANNANMNTQLGTATVASNYEAHSRLETEESEDKMDHQPVNARTQQVAVV